MPEFPRAESTRQLTTQAPSPMAPASTEGQVLEQVANTALKAQDTTVKWANAIDTIQSTKAKANFKTGMLDILQRAENDPDYNASEKYIAEIKKLREQSGEGFASPYAKSMTGIELDYEQRAGAIQIGGIFKKKVIDAGQASALQLLDLESKNPSVDSEKNIKAILEKQVAAGVFDRKDAYELEKKTIRDAKRNTFTYDLNTSPAVAEEKLAKNVYDFDIDELSKAKGIYDREVGKIQAKNENDLLTSYLNGEELAPLAIKQMMNEKQIDAPFAEALINKINNPKPDKISQDSSFIEFQNRGADLLEKAKDKKASAAEISKYMTDVMQAHAQGILDRDDVNRMIKNFNPFVQSALEKVSEDILETKSPKTWQERLSFWSDEYADRKPEIKARMYRKLIDGVSKGQDGEKLMQTIINDELDTHLAKRLTEPDRKYAVNPDTKARIYSDDGGATWKDEKTGEIIK